MSESARALSRIAPKIAAGKRRLQQRNPDTHVVGGTNDFAAELIRIRVRRTVRLLMQIVELAHARDARKQHLHEDHSCRVENVFIGKPRQSSIPTRHDRLTRALLRSDRAARGGSCANAC